jgi:uncharacterized protein (DUF934 family)
MALFKNDRFQPDEWQRLAEGTSLPLEGKPILGLAQWQEQKERLSSSNLAIGLLLDPAADPRALAPEIGRFSLIAVDFPKFSDGRGFSLARRLRGELGFSGELRAVGDILYDQLQLLERCGFDAFEITHAATIALLESGRRPGLGVFYQPAARSESGEATRPWARRTLSPAS